MGAYESKLNAKKVAVQGLSVVLAVGTLLSPLPALGATTALAEDESTHTTVIHHPAEYETVHHDAEYKTVHHDAVVEMRDIAYDGTDITGRTDEYMRDHALEIAEGKQIGYVTKPVEVSPAYDEQKLIREAYDEQVLVRDAWDETVTN